MLRFKATLYFGSYLHSCCVLCGAGACARHRRNASSLPPPPAHVLVPLPVAGVLLLLPLLLLLLLLEECHNAALEGCRRQARGVQLFPAQLLMRARKSIQ